MNDNTKSKIKTTAIIILSLILVAVGIRLWYFLLITDKDGVFGTILLNLFTTIISIILITIGYTIYTEIEFKKSVKDVVISSLKGDYDIIGSYNDETIESIIDNGRKKLLENKSYRTNFKYDVGYEPADNNSYKIKQEISYRKHIKIKNNSNSVPISIFFTNRKDPFEVKLLTSLANNIIFYRGKLSNSVFQEIINKTDVEIISFLNFVVKLYNHSTSQEDVVDINITKNEAEGAIFFSFEADDKYLKIENDAFKSFSAKVICEYPSDKNNYYYCVFPEPVKGEAKFSICFDKSIVLKSNIHYLKLLSTPNYEVTESPNSNGLVLSLKKELDDEVKKHNIIFPHSGILFHW